MIHQLIFARPKPGMSEKDFQDYWVNTHAVKFASKIPQIRRYLVTTRVDVGPPDPDPRFSGVAEIWLRNEREQLESLQTKEFLQGARLDEPNWAAFWATLVLDTTAHVLLEGPPLTRNPNWVKQYVFMKRKPGIPLEAFRKYLLQVHAPLALELPGLRRYLQCHVRDGAYGFGEARFDAVGLHWFDDEQAIARLAESTELQERVEPDLREILDERYRFSMAAREHWVIGPEER